MKIHLTLFAGAAEKAGAKTVELEFQTERTSVQEIRQQLVTRFPQLDPIAPHLHFAAGTEYLAPDEEIAGDAELVCFPPVSGG